MHLVEQRLNTFTYRFRRLSWLEEVRLHVPADEDPRDTILAHALHDISGLPVGSLEDARSVIRRIPRTLRRRLFVVYRGNLPADRYYSAATLYRAPEYTAHSKRLVEEGDAAEDEAEDELLRRFGPAETSEARELERILAAQAMNARKRGRMANSTVGSELLRQIHDGAIDHLPSEYLARTREDIVTELEELLDVGARIRPLLIGDRQVGWARGVHLSERKHLRRWVRDDMAQVAHVLRLGTSLTEAEVNDLCLVEMRSLSRVVKAMTDSDMRLYPFLHAFSTTSVSEQLWQGRGTALTAYSDRVVRLPDGQASQLASAPDHARLWALLCVNRIAAKQRLDASSNALMIIRPWVGKNAEGLSADLKRSHRMLQTDSMEPWKEIIRAAPEAIYSDGWAHSGDGSIDGMKREMFGMVNNDRHERVMAEFERQERERADAKKRRVEHLIHKRRAELERPSGLVVMTEAEVLAQMNTAGASRQHPPVIEEESQSSLADRLARYQ